VGLENNFLFRFIDVIKLTQFSKVKPFTCSAEISSKILVRNKKVHHITGHESTKRNRIIPLLLL
jgi:hypothetical protein